MTAIIIGDLADLTITEINVCLCFITAFQIIVHILSIFYYLLCVLFS